MKNLKTKPVNQEGGAAEPGWYTAQVTDIRRGKIKGSVVFELSHKDKRFFLVAKNEATVFMPGLLIAKLAEITKSYSSTSMIGKWAKVLIKLSEYHSLSGEVYFNPIITDVKPINSRVKSFTV